VKVSWDYSIPFPNSQLFLEKKSPAMFQSPATSMVSLHVREANGVSGIRTAQPLGMMNPGSNWNSTSLAPISGHRSCTQLTKICPAMGETPSISRLCFLKKITFQYPFVDHVFICFLGEKTWITQTTSNISGNFSTGHFVPPSFAVVQALPMLMPVPAPFP